MTRRWLIGVALAVPVLAFAGLEIWLGVNEEEWSLTFTDYLIKLPWTVLMPFAVGAAGWFVWHLWERKRHRERNRR